MRHTRSVLSFTLSLLLLAAFMRAQNPVAADSSFPPPRVKEIHLKHLLVIGQTKGFEHDSVSDGMAAIYNLGHDSGLWDATLRTDTELITKKDLGRNAKNLDYFDALVFLSTTGSLTWTTARSKT